MNDSSNHEVMKVADVIAFLQQVPTSANIAIKVRPKSHGNYMLIFSGRYDESGNVVHLDCGSADAADAPDRPRPY